MLQYFWEYLCISFCIMYTTEDNCYLPPLEFSYFIKNIVALLFVYMVFLFASKFNLVYRYYSVKWALITAELNRHQASLEILKLTEKSKECEK